MRLSRSTSSLKCSVPFFLEQKRSSVVFTEWTSISSSSGVAAANHGIGGKGAGKSRWRTMKCIDDVDRVIGGTEGESLVESV